VEDLVESIKKIGLRTPLTIKRVGLMKLHLITGLHRLEAAKSLGWTTVPCVSIKGGPVVARLWEISENLHRAELTVLEENELIIEWRKLTGAGEAVSAQNGQKVGLGRPKGGLSEAARQLPGKGTQTAKRKKLQRADKIGIFEPKVRQEIIAAGFDDNQSKLLKIAAEDGTKARLEKLQQLKADRGKAHSDAPEDSTGRDKPPYDVLKRERKPSKKWKLAWSQASKSDRKRFITEIMEFSFDG
jgi:ParB family chromosome partitioning protein